jgi:hypothetical protein
VFKIGHSMLRVDANVFTNQSRTVDSGWSSDFCVGRTISHAKNSISLKTFQLAQ